MSDLTERLRNRSFRLATRDFNGDGASLAKEAADEIDRLTRELAEARDKALEDAAKEASAAVMKFRSKVNGRYYPGYHEDMRDDLRSAIRALKASP